jgi:ankyrin repeat protein
VSGNLDRAAQLIRQGGDVNAGSGCALIAAAQRGHTDLVRLLLEYKADPNRRASGDLPVIFGASTPLEAAVTSRKAQTVQALLEGGASPRSDFEAFEVVLNFSDVEMAELLLRHGANANMTTPALEYEYASVEIGPRESRQVKVPRRDLEPDRIDNTAKRFQCGISLGSQGSLLYLAVGRGRDPDRRSRIVKLLIDHGADPNAKTLNGSTPLMEAAKQHNHRVMTMLLDAGADVKAADRCGRTAEEYADFYPPGLTPSRLAPQTKALLQDRQRK